MPPVQMSYEEVYAQLKAWGNESARAMYARHGAPSNQFGVLLGKLRGLAKKIKTNHPLAMQLWDSGNADAMILATMLMDSSQLAKAQVEAMVQPLTYTKFIDELIYNAVAKTPFANELRDAWIHAPGEMVGRAGWNLMLASFDRKTYPPFDIEAALAQIEAEVKAAPLRKQEVMNQCLVEIGVRYEQYTERCIAIGERLGKFDQRPVPKGCYSSYAPEWINAVLKRGVKMD